MNPWIIIGLIVAWLASLAGVGYWQNEAGQTTQQVADQVRFDKINQDIADNKALANGIYRSAQANIITLQAERDKFKTQLEKDHEANRIATAALRDKYAGVSLRFRADQGAGPGPGGTSARPSTADASSVAGAPFIQLPGALAASLRRIVWDADQLRDDYRACYEYATGVK